MKTIKLAQLSEKGKTFLTLTMIDEVMVHEWSGVIIEETFKKAIDKIAELSITHRPMGYLSRPTAFAGIGPNSQAYAAAMTSNYVKNHFNKLHPGVKFKQVMLVTKDVFLAVTANGYAKKLDETIETIFLYNQDEVDQIFGWKE